MRPAKRTLPASLLLLTLLATALGAGCADDPNALLPGAGARRTTRDTAATSPDDPSGEGPPATSGGVPGTSPSSPSSPSTPPGTAPCKPGLTSIKVNLAPSAGGGPIRATATADGGTLVAWSSGGQVRVRRIDGAGATVGSDRSIAGNTVHGIAAMPNGVALLVARAPDVLALVKLADDGAVAFDKQLLGNVDHDVVGSEWFDFQPAFFNESGRLVWTGSKLVVYVPIFRRWPDGVAHTGDQLKSFDANGDTAPGNGWDWGCSHSLDVRLSPDGEKPVCLSDCFPQKAILLGRNNVISAEPSGNCAGGSDTRLGGLATVGGATWLTFASREGRTSRDVTLMKLGEPNKIFLTQGTNATAPHLAPFGSGMIAAWRTGSAHVIQRLDAQGNTVGSQEDVSTLPFAESDDFLAWPGGDAGWLSETGGGLEIARLGACQ